MGWREWVNYPDRLMLSVRELLDTAADLVSPSDSPNIAHWLVRLRRDGIITRDELVMVHELVSNYPGLRR